MNSYATALLAGSQLARSEAIRRNAPVTLCATSNGSSCSSSNQWESG
ncbi:GspH/FimT family protein [Variovorax sp. RT4R15]